ncbi:hypothetical protein ACS0TY_017849 [Phlomoides rotata]
MYPLSFLTFLLTFLTFFDFSQAIVPPSKTFKYVNSGEFGEYYVEYSADNRVLSIGNYPFTLCFYNSTPNSYTLGLRMGHGRSESIMRCVWDANQGKPVRENATLTLGSNGNLVLADVDGLVTWQTSTANKGVVGLELLQNGNLVLYDSKGKYVWQSFDYPTDTLLVSQALRVNGAQLSLLAESPLLNRLMGLIALSWNKDIGPWVLAFLDFYCAREYDYNHAFELGFRFNLSNSDSYGTRMLSRPKYNSTYTMLRVDIDGNLRMYTYDEHVDWGAWEVTYVLFDRDDGRESECKLPKKCGSFEICDADQCVACPTKQGLLGWSEACTPPPLPPCKGLRNESYYYKVDGVDHFTSDYNEGIGPMTLAQCKDKCSKDCKSLGFFYRAESSKCLVVNELGTLVKVSNPSHVGYIKMSI